VMRVLAAVPRVIWTWLFGLLAAVITLLSLVPRSASQHLGMFDKIEHFAAYLAVGACGSLAVSHPYRRIHVFIAVVVLATVLEALQALVPSRTPSAVDVLTSTAGVAVGILCGTSLRRRVDQLPTAP
jgi:VanZ family protein